MRDSNDHIKIARVQNEIKKHLGLGDEEAMFEYINAEGGVTLNLVTINSSHSQSFLFRTTRGIDKVSALSEMQKYVESYRDEEGSYTIQWAVRGSNKLYTSYFRGKDIFDVLGKFTYGRDKSTVQVYSISLNPIT